jgi:hypothetical protein
VAAPIEHKVKVSTAGAYIAGVVGLAVVSSLTPANVIPFLPAWASALVAPLLPAAVTFASGWIAKHTPRTVS